MESSSSTASQAPTQPANLGSGSLTTTSVGGLQGRPQPVLRLRGASETETDRDSSARPKRRRIQWAEDVVDNEGLGRKSSKVCCIYHAPRPIDESSDESESDSDDSSSGEDDERARPTGHGKGHGKGKDCGHDHGEGKGKGKARKRSPNAYEKQPSVKGKGTG